jgi:hypothetical protein
MRIWLIFLLTLGITVGIAAAASGQGVASAIQTIQQAPDPSAAVTAFADGVAVDRNNPQLYEAFVHRLVDLGLPELAFHQAQMLIGLEPTNGLGWAVAGYVDARRGRMPDAVSEISKAGQYAPESQFVQRTAGEVVAWYDFKADKSQLPADVGGGVDNIRSRLHQTPAFTAAYDAARNAYQSQAANAAAPQAQSQASQPGTGPAYAEAPPYYYPPPDYYADNDDYYYDWGPGWIEPSPWWWWQPAGYFGGAAFFPFGAFFVFDDDFFFRHHDHHAFHDNHVNRALHGDNPVVWHHGPQGTTRFFGAPARPSASLALQTPGMFESGAAASIPRPELGINPRAEAVPIAPKASQAPIVNGPAPWAGRAPAESFRGGAGSPEGFGEGQGVSEPRGSFEGATAPMGVPRGPAVEGGGWHGSPAESSGGNRGGSAPAFGGGFHGGGGRR